MYWALWRHLARENSYLSIYTTLLSILHCGLDKMFCCWGLCEYFFTWCCHAVCPFEFSCILHALYRDKQTIKRSLLKETNSRGQCFSLLLLLPKAKGKKKKHKKKITLISCKLLGTALKTTLFHAVWIWTFCNILPSRRQWRMESCDNYSIQLMLNLWTQLISLVVIYEVKMKA